MKRKEVLNGFPPRFILSKKEQSGEKVLKLPVNPKTGHAAGWEKIENQVCFIVAQKELESKDDSFSLGFVFHQQDCILGLDFDDCIIDGKVVGVAKRIMDLGFNTYIETSTSGAGLHIVYISDALAGIELNKTRGIVDGFKFEVYTKNRYFRLSQELEEENICKPFSLSEKELFSILAVLGVEIKTEPLPTTIDHKEKNGSTGRTRSNVGGYNLGAEAIVDKIRASSTGSIVSLWNGDWQAGYGSQSEADCALCAHIAFYTKNQNTIAQVFENSGLMREKFKRDDYRSATIEAALNIQNSSYMENLDDLKDIRETFVTIKYKRGSLCFFGKSFSVKVSSRSLGLTMDGNAVLVDLKLPASRCAIDEKECEVDIEEWLIEKEAKRLLERYALRRER